MFAAGMSSPHNSLLRGDLATALPAMEQALKLLAPDHPEVRARLDGLLSVLLRRYPDNPEATIGARSARRTAR